MWKKEHLTAGKEVRGVQSVSRLSVVIGPLWYETIDDISANILTKWAAGAKSNMELIAGAMQSRNNADLKRFQLWRKE